MHSTRQRIAGGLTAGAAAILMTLGASTPAVAASSSGATVVRSETSCYPDDVGGQLCFTTSGRYNLVFTPKGRFIGSWVTRTTAVLTDSSGNVVSTQTQRAVSHTVATDDLSTYFVSVWHLRGVDTDLYRTCQEKLLWVLAGGAWRVERDDITCTPAV